MGLQSDILEKAKSEVLSAFQNQVESIDNLEDLDSLLENFNLAIEVSISNGNAPSNKANARKATGAAKMWKKLRKIVKDEGVTLKEARILYLRNKEDGNGKQTTRSQSKPRGFGAKMSKQQKKYWRAINKIVADKNCTTAEARQIYKKQKAA